MSKASDAFRTIGEVAVELDVPKHVLRFWEGKFPHIRPMKRGGGRRYYRPEDLELLRGIRHLLHAEGYTIKGVQKILREQGIDQVKAAAAAAAQAGAAGASKKGAKRGRGDATTSVTIETTPSAARSPVSKFVVTGRDAGKLSDAKVSDQRASERSSETVASAQKSVAQIRQDVIASAIRELEACRQILSRAGAVADAKIRRKASDGPASRADVTERRHLFVLMVDTDAQRAALEYEEQTTPRLSADLASRYQRVQARDGVAEAGRWRTAHIALRLALEPVVGSAQRGQPFAIEPGGRPVLSATSGTAALPWFSLSHSHNRALIAVSAWTPVGVDIETLRPIKMTADRRRRLEAAAEARAPHAALPIEADARTLQAWVRLEAAAKASGAGIGRVLTRAGVIGRANQQRDLSSLPSNGGAGPEDDASASAQDGFEVRDLALGPEWFGAIAGSDLPASVPVTPFPDSPADLPHVLAALA